MSESDMTQLFDLIKKIEQEQKEKKPSLKTEEMSDLKPTVKGLKQIIRVSYREFEKFKEHLKGISSLLFYIASGYGDIVYVLAVFRKSVQIDYPRIRCYKGFSSYWENITWLWKQGIYVDSYGFVPGEELRKCEKVAEDILRLDDDEARSTLSLKDYALYLEVKNK